MYELAKTGEIEAVRIEGRVALVAESLESFISRLPRVVA
jgi:hypothetical protein